MAATDNLIDFDIIETQKENIQSLPSGRSAKALASVLSPLSARSTPPLSQTQTLNDAIRAEYEKELLTIDECDDPLDVYDRYVKWTLDAYPSAQATTQSGLLPLLERATKAFLSASNYKNDPRYLKLWLHYIRLFSDAPRETFAYLSRHNIGDSLALFYEEFAAWLESAGRWTQAEEVYKMGIEREAHPTARLIRKFGEFEKRLQNRPEHPAEPTSPALPTVRPALATKVDPFAIVSPSATSSDPQAAGRAQQAGGSKKSKLEIFSDATATEERPSSNGSVTGWEQHGTLADRKKENMIGARPWAGETMKSASHNIGVPKMTVFKDQTTNPNVNDSSHPRPSVDQRAVNPKTGRIERVFVNLEAVYPDPTNPAVEYCFEELRAAKRGWLQHDWRSDSIPQPRRASLPSEQSTLTESFERTIALNDENAENVPPSGIDNKEANKADVARKIRREEKANRTRKIKVMEVRGETTTVQTNLSSPQGPRIKRKSRDREPTMTMHSKAATDEVYELFSAPLKSTTETVEEEEEEESEEESSDEEEDEDDDATSTGESTGTGHLSTGTASEYEDEDQAEETQNELTGTTEKSISSNDGADESDAQDATGTGENTGWTDFNFANDIPKTSEEDETPQATGESNALDRAPVTRPSSLDLSSLQHPLAAIEQEILTTPTSPTASNPITNAATHYIPTKPSSSDYAPTNPYRDPALVAQSRLPFMTPIAEKTESSLGTVTKDKDYFGNKTPCPKGSLKDISTVEEAICSSPFTEDLDISIGGSALTEVKEGKIAQPILEKETVQKSPRSRSTSAPQGPLIPDTQLNPMSPAIQSFILSSMQPSLSSYSNFYDHRHSMTQAEGMRAELKRFSKAFGAAKSSSKNEKTVSSASLEPLELRFDDCGEGPRYKYSIKRELGRGAFAPVYLARRVFAYGSNQSNSTEDNSAEGDDLVAVKLEDDPPNAWEFHMLSLTTLLLRNTRAASSVISAYSCHLYTDASFIVEQYRPRGTLLDAVNKISETTSGAMDEVVAMFFAVELLRVVEALHGNGIIHGDIKADNLLLRVDSSPSSSSATSFSSSTQTDMLPPYTVSSKSHSTVNTDSTGWQSHGLTLIDFGRAIHMANFKPNVQFIADWPTTDADCPEMRELRPWTYQVDYFGMAGVLYVLLFGKWMEVISTVDSKTYDSEGGFAGVGSKVYKLKEPLKRWWCIEIWAEVFQLLLNPVRCAQKEEGGRMPVVKGLRDVREKMEVWLEKNGEKGVGLRAWLRRLEAAKK